MNSAFGIIIFIMKIMLIFVLLYIAYQLFRFHRKTDLNKRFSPYSLDLLEKDEESLFELLFSNYQFFRDRVSNWLIMKNMFINYSKKYEKYIHKFKVSNLDEMNYITNKIFIGIICVLLLIVSSLLKSTKLNLILILLMFFSGFFALDIYLIIVEKIRKKSIERDMSKAIIIMNNAFKSGYSIMQAIYLVQKQLDGPISNEFKKMYMDIAFGLSMEVVFNRFAKRVNCVEAKYMATSLGVVNKTGGNIIQVFNAVERNSFTRKKLRDELQSVSSSARAMFKILVFIPLVIILLLLMLDPGYFIPLFTTTIGFLCLLIIILIYVLYIIIIRRIVYLEVDL